ncbi:MAG TPA: hypothetical protein VJ724_02770, partial [Tahibacter sp.]|nr:hypothetical protein [Tahibacter sp.]
DAKKAAPGDAVAAAPEPPKTDAKPDAPKGPAKHAQRRTVQIGFVDGEYIEVRDGLKEGDQVITVGRNAVRDGTLVQVLEAGK